MNTYIFLTSFIFFEKNDEIQLKIYSSDTPDKK